jgi:hypothetical protein
LNKVPEFKPQYHQKKKKRIKLLRSPKIICSPSYADYRPKTNAVILLDMGHTLKGECALEE